jgi:tyrosine-protein phosphatase SIW14
MEDLTPEMEQFMCEEGIQIFHYRTEGNKEPFLEISTEDINHALVKLLDQRSHPGKSTKFSITNSLCDINRALSQS